MERYRQVAKIIATPPNDTKKILEILENSGFAVLEDHSYSDGDHFILMEKMDEYEYR